MRFDKGSTSMPLAMGLAGPVPKDIVATTVSPRTGLAKRTGATMTNNTRKIVIVLRSLRLLGKLKADNFLSRTSVILRY